MNEAPTRKKWLQFCNDCKTPRPVDMFKNEESLRCSECLVFSSRKYKKRGHARTHKEENVRKDYGYGGDCIYC